MDPHRSDIPDEAQARVTKRFGNGCTQVAELYVGDAMVGVRWFNDDGTLNYEWPHRHGKRHGLAREFGADGAVLFVEPYVQGRIHGTAVQFRRDGTVLGTYTMERGTGVDLWWEESGGGPDEHLAEVRPLVDGVPHGVEWLLSVDGVWAECHWHRGERHGVQRVWRGGALAAGYPRFWVRNEVVGVGAYGAACETDPTLRVYEPAEDEKRRGFPELIRAHFRGEQCRLP